MAIDLFETYIKRLELKRTIREALPEIVNAFVEFYGESERTNIEKKLTDKLYIATYSSLENLESTIISLDKIKSDQLMDEIKKTFQMSEAEAAAYLCNIQYAPNTGLNGNYRKYLSLYEKTGEERLRDFHEDAVRFFKKYFSNVNNENLHKIKDTEAYKRLMSMDSSADMLKNTWNYYLDDSNAERNFEEVKKRAVSVLKTMHPSITPDNIDEFESTGKLKREKDILMSINSIEEQFAAYRSSLEKYTSYIDRMKKYKTSLKREYMRLFIEKFPGFLTEKEVEDFNSGKNIPLLVEIFDQSNFDAFKSEAKETIKENGKEAKALKSMQISFFNNIGFYLGNDLEKYMKDPRCQSLLPQEDVLDEMIRVKNEFVREIKTKIHSASPEYQIARKEIDELGLYCKDDEFDPVTLEFTTAAILPNCRITQNDIETYNILYFSGKTLPQFTDISLIHELNHVYETELLNIDEYGANFIVGWDFASQGKTKGIEKKFEDRTDKRNYELINEIINELISQDITSILHSRGSFIFNNRDFGEIKGGTSYEEFGILVREFYSEFKTSIIASRTKGNIEVIFDTVGKDNFDALSDLFNEVFTYFGSNGFGYAYLSKREGIEDEKTRKYDEVVSKKDAILSKMREYAKTKSQMTA